MKARAILIAYQDDLSIRSFWTFFDGTGYRVETAKIVSELIRRVQSGSIHVVLLDDELEGVKAYDLVPLIKKINGMLQVIVISSEESLEQARRLRRAGIFYHAMKPVDMEELNSAVECAFKKIEREHPVDKEKGFLSFFVPGEDPV